MIWVHSEAIHLYLKKIRAMAKEILCSEMYLDCKRTRIEFEGLLYPLDFYFFEDHKKLGLFDHRFYRIGLHKSLLLYKDQEVLKDVLRHELAHFFHFISNRNDFLSSPPHGGNFKKICQQFGWKKEIAMAQKTLANENENENFIVKKKLLDKIQKLFSLGTSSNVFEAQSAIAKANELLLKHHFTHSDTFIESDSNVYVKSILSSKRLQAKHKAIIEVLKHFQVVPIINRSSSNEIYIEIMGSKINIELCEYMADFLDHEFESLWKKAKLENSTIKGLHKKNSFMKGLAEGHLKQIKKQQECHRNALIKIEGHLQEKLKLVYPNLRQTLIKEKKDCLDSKKIGKDYGEKIKFRPGIKENNKKTIKGLLEIIF